jgi:hypothetical protein
MAKIAVKPLFNPRRAHHRSTTQTSDDAGVSPHAGEASGPMNELVIAISCFVIGFCATDCICHRIRTGSWF